MAASTLAWPVLVVLDLGEVVRQVGEARTGLALLAALVMVGHGAVVVRALLALPQPRRSDATGDLTPLHRGE